MEKEKEIVVLFGWRVRQKRLELGYTQEELAKLANLSRSYLGEVETGKRNITLKSAEKIAKVLQVEVAYLLTQGS